MLTGELSKLPKETQDIVHAILAANRVDEQKIIDDLIADINARRTRLFDIIRVDLSVNRSADPLEITGAGTVLIAYRASNATVNCAVSFEVQEPDSNRRYTLVQGRRLKFPFTKFYIYHSAQAAGTFMELIRARSLPSLQLGVEDDSSDSASAGLETALGMSTAIATGQVAVDNAGNDVIKAANTNRKRITIKVPASATQAVFIGITGVAAGDGHRLDPGDAITLHTTAAIYGVTAAAGAVTVTYLEE